MAAPPSATVTFRNRRLSLRRLAPYDALRMLA